MKLLDSLREMAFGGDPIVQLERVENALERVARGLDRLLDRPAPEPPDPFVCVIAEGKRAMPSTNVLIAPAPLERISLGKSARARANGTCLELRTHLPLEHVRVVVFADLERVDITSIQYGVDLITAAMGSCPVAYFDRWDVGIVLQVQCRRVDR